MKSHLFLSVGSNTEAGQVEKAVEWLSGKLQKFASSSLYTTPAVQGKGKPYVNAVVEGYITGAEEDFNNLLKDYEKTCGRDDTARKEGRVPIDIDIVVRDGSVVRERDFAHSFFRIGYSELTCPVIKK